MFPLNNKMHIKIFLNQFLIFVLKKVKCTHMQTHTHTGTLTFTCDILMMNASNIKFAYSFYTNIILVLQI